MIFDFSQWQQNHNTTTDKKAAISSFMLIIFRGNFASKPMTLPKIDHVIYVAAHA